MSLNALLALISLPVANSLGLTRFPEHFDTIVLSFLAFLAIQWASPLLFNLLSPQHYGKASMRVKQGWAVRACSMFHAVIVVIWAFRCIDLPELSNNKVSGTHPTEEKLMAFACGFLWDVLEEAVVNFQNIGLALHGILVLTALLLTFRPFFAYMGVRFLLMEISTPLLNIQWFLDKTGRTGTTLQLVNGVALIVVFFCARICYGTVTAYTFFVALYEARALVHPALLFIYASGTASLQLLNCLWMYKMLDALRRRFPSQAHRAHTE